MNATATNVVPTSDTRINVLSPQAQQILSYMQNGNGTISGVEAQATMKVRSLTRRITEIRDAGFDIHSEWRRDPLGQRYVRYSLVS